MAGNHVVKARHQHDPSEIQSHRIKVMKSYHH
jgi:hypothetical protein